MTITKQRLEEIALEVAQEILMEDGYPYATYSMLKAMGFSKFALALIRRVEAECEISGHGFHGEDGKCVSIGQHKSSMSIGNKAFKSKPLTVLPLVEE